MSFMDLFNKNQKDDEDYLPDGYFLVGDIVQTRTGEKGKVTTVKSKIVDVYIFEACAIETYPESDLHLIKGIDAKQQYHKGVYGSAFSYNPCNHWMDEFKLQDGLSIYLSARGMGNKKRDVDEVPTVGCYMDHSWNNGYFTLTPHAPQHEDLFVREQVPSMFISWGDMQAIPLMEYSQAIVWCMSRMMSGEVLEIGCIGAHGRTGTLLAGILVYQGMTATEAMAKVRKDHCSKAIESKKQEDLIRNYHKELEDTDAKDGINEANQD